MNKLLRKVGVLFLLLTSCNLDADLEDPNQVTQANADVDLVMNAVQLEFSDFFNAAERSASGLVRLEAMTGYRYQTSITPQGLNNLWTFAYEDVLVNSELVLKLATPKNLTTHVAVAKILKAYTYLTLVDIFGDVPQADALKAVEGKFNPELTPGRDVYQYSITLLNEARVELAKTGAEAGAPLARDIFYGGNRTKWTALANSLELKALLNLSLNPGTASQVSARIDALMTMDLIDTEAENFVYSYGTATVPASRHPLYQQYYNPNVGNAGGYIANYFLHEMFQGKINPSDPTATIEDPRWRYYFYRQVGSIEQALRVDPKSLGCTPGAVPTHYSSAGVKMFCVFNPGFYGRDHGDGFGVPPDGSVITCAGVYPAGGKIDNTALSASTFAQATRQGDGANGAGIHPIYMSWFTDFMKAEIFARRGNNPAAKTALVAGIGKSITQVRNFATGRGQVLSPGREPSTTIYLTAVEQLFDNAANKLDVVGKEYYLSLWGNSIEAYNSYRRTSSPRDFQPTLQLNPGPYYRSFVYPANFANLNSNAVQKDFNSTNKVFWDTNPDVLN